MKKFKSKYVSVVFILLGILLSWDIQSMKVNNEEKITYNKDIEPIIESTCAIENCHDGTMPPYFLQYQRAKAWAHRIKFRVNYAKNPMPPKYSRKTLTEQQIETITQWVESGAPEE
ncbi:MAG: hypothetical protein ACNS62_13120 [Candidatus Cyclobacteriaceae bacterium M3_2C_046]